MKTVHFMGIGGSGASACASIALSQGFKVTGCDININNEFTENFDKDILYEEHSPIHLRRVDILVMSPAVTSLDQNNPELKEAKKRKIQAITWQEFLGRYLQKNKFVIAVCGTHGKSTTTAMLGSLLENGGLDPTVVLGAIVPKWRSNYRIGKSKYFIIEADEFNNNFLNFEPDITLVLNIEMDHPEYFKDITHYKESFKKFLIKSKKNIFANLSDRNVYDVTYGNATVIDFSKKIIDFPLKIPGFHNILNASAVFNTGIALGIPEYSVRKSLMSFEGIGRRFELLGNVNGAKIYSDFAHHPTEIEKTLKAAREKFPNQKIWLIYEPHMFSRTKAFFDDFVKVFQNFKVDQTYIIDIYPSREIDTNLVNSKQLVEAIDRNNVRYVSFIKDLTEVLSKLIKKNDVLFFMGAGSIDQTAREFAKKYAKSEV